MLISVVCEECWQYYELPREEAKVGVSLHIDQDGAVTGNVWCLDESECARMAAQHREREAKCRTSAIPSR
jgi:hypothetical protein